MKQHRISVLFSFFLSTAIFAQPTVSLYSLAEASIGYVKHEILMDSSRSRYPEIVRKLESRMNSKILDQQYTIASGTGFLISEDGLLVTARHVIQIGDLKKIRAAAASALLSAIDSEYAKSFGTEELPRLRADLTSMLSLGQYQLSVTISGKVYRSVRTVAVAQDEGLDLAVLKVEATGLIPLPLADPGDITSALVGTEVYSLGYPLGSLMEKAFRDLAITMNKGNISAIRRGSLNVQHTAAISPGNSGGPLVDSAGTVVGVNVGMMTEGNSLNFSVGADQLAHFLEKSGIRASRRARVGQEVKVGTVISSDEVKPSRVDAISTNALGEYEVSSDVLIDAVKGSRVFVNDKYVGESPLFIQLVSPVTEIYIEGDSGEFKGKLRRLSSLQGSSVLRPTLRITRTQVSIESVPAGAAVRLNGRLIGNTPISATLEPGTYRTEFTLEGYVFPAGSVTAGEARTVSVQSRGRETFAFRVEGLDRTKATGLVFKGEDLVLEFKPDESIRLPSGSWTLSISGDRAFSGVQMPIFQDKKDGAIDVSGYRRSTYLSFYGVPGSASVYIDGRLTTLPTVGDLHLDPGIYDVFVWDYSYRPLETKVTVGFDAESWVRFPAHVGYRKLFRRNLVVGSSSLLMGVLFFSAVTYFNERSNMADGAESVRLDNLASLCILAGFYSSGQALYTLPKSLILHGRYKKDLERLSTAKGGEE